MNPAARILHVNTPLPYVIQLLKRTGIAVIMTRLNTIAALIVLVLSLTSVLEGFPKDPECDKTKGCFYECEDETFCEFLVTWVDHGDNVTYTLTTNTEPPNLWMAVAFSDDQNMGNDSVTGCTYFYDKIETFNAMNDGKSAPRILGNEGVTLLTANKVDGVFNCSFDRVKAAGVTIERFDLYQPWYLLFAKGRINDLEDLQYHKKDRYSSAVPYDPSFRPLTTPATGGATTAAVTTDSTTTTATVTTDSTTTTAAVTTFPTTPATGGPTTAAVTTDSTTTTAAVTTDSTTTTAAVTTFPTTPATPEPSGSRVTKVNDCGRRVGCFSDCVGKVCSFIVSWQIQDTDAIYSMASTEARKGSTWIAIGFSNDTRMGGDDVMGCVSDTTGQVLPITGWNTEYNSPDRYTDKDIKLVDKRSEDGVLSCTFRRPIAAASSGNLAASQGSRRMDVSKSWIMFFARGPGGIGKGLDETYMYNHGKDRFISTQRVSVSDNVDLGSIYHEFPLVKTHGIFMIIAWIFASSVGFLISRYYRTFSGSHLFFGYSWLHAHGFCMLLALSATFIGFVVIFVQAGGYSLYAQDNGILRAHPILGIIILILAVFNPLSAVIRPPPGSRKRPIFDWTHRIVGVGAHVLAVVNIFFGVQMEKADVPYYLVYVLAAYTVWELLVTMVLEVLSWFGHKSYDVQIDDTSLMVPSEVPIAQESPRTLLIKQIIFWLNCAVLLSFTISLIVLLRLGNNHMGV